MIIGVTGGVGAGKSTILDYLKNRYNAAVIQADDVAKELMMPGGVSYKAVTDHFGDGILTAGYGSPIDRAALAEIVFNDEKQLSILNSLTHPAVKTEIQRLIRKYQSLGYSIIIIEAALLIQAGYQDIIDELWTVYADKRTRVERLISTRNYSEEKAESIISSQMSDEQMNAAADLVIDNSGSTENTCRQIDEYLSGR